MTYFPTLWHTFRLKLGCVSRTAELTMSMPTVLGTFTMTLVYGSGRAPCLMHGRSWRASKMEIFSREVGQNRGKRCAIQSFHLKQYLHYGIH